MANNVYQYDQQGPPKLQKRLLPLLIAQALAIPISSQAATVTVTSLVDGDFPCTLRHAIVAVNTGGNNTNGCSFSGPWGSNDTIRFDSYLAGGTVNLSQGELIITEDVTITGLGVNTTVNARGLSRVMQIGLATVVLEDLTVTGGSLQDGYLGGGIQSQGNLTITNTTITGNTANGGGAGIRSSGNLTITDSTVSGNTANASSGRGGGIFIDGLGLLTIQSSTVSGNIANEGGGVSVFCEGTVNVVDSTVSGNTAGFGGGIGFFAPGYHDICDPDITISASTVTLNRGLIDGGGLFIVGGADVTLTDSTISGNTAQKGGGMLLRDMNAPGRVTDGVYNRLSISNSTVSGNSAFSGGGGFHVANSRLNAVSASVIKDNIATDGGGGYAAEGATVTITNSTITGNTANGANPLGTGGGLVIRQDTFVTLRNSTLANNSAWYGGGVWAGDNGEPTIDATTISGNTAGVAGGGVFLANQGRLYARASTFSGNRAIGFAAGNGGAVLAGSSGFSTLNQVTIVNNYAYNNLGGGLFVGTGHSVTIRNSILADSERGSDCSISGNGLITAGDDSIIESDNCDTTALNADPQLGPLEDNGGPTLTHMPGPDSPAIDLWAGEPPVFPCDSSSNFTRDQRGEPRLDGACDAGSVELQDPGEPPILDDGFESPGDI